MQALRLANADVLPFHYSDYAAAVKSYVADLEQVQAETPGAAQVDLSPLTDARGDWGAALRLWRPMRPSCWPPRTPTRSPRAGRSRAINTALMKQERRW